MSMYSYMYKYIHVYTCIYIYMMFEFRGGATKITRCAHATRCVRGRNAVRAVMQRGVRDY